MSTDTPAGDLAPQKSTAGLHDSNGTDHGTPGGPSSTSVEGRLPAISFSSLRPFAGPLILFGMVALFTILYGDSYFSKTNLINNVLGSVAFIAIVAAGQTIVMVVGEFDLSVSGLGTLAAVSAGVLLATTDFSGEPTDPTPVLLAVGLGLLIGLAGGMFNGLLVTRLGVLAFIATLATSVVFQNLGAFRVDGRTVYGLTEPGFVDVVRSEILGIPAKLLIAIGVGLVVWFMLDHTPLGRKMYAVGGNPEAARYSGINVKNVRLVAFALCGMFAAGGAIMQAANNATSNTLATQGFMLQSITAVFLGMAMFRNGVPNIFGSLLGVVMLRVLENGLNYTSIDDNLQDVILGFAIIVAVLPLAIERLRAAR